MSTQGSPRAEARGVWGGSLFIDSLAVEGASLEQCSGGSPACSIIPPAAQMTADDRRPGAAGVAELLERGPLAVPRRSLRERARALVRDRLLRATGPQARYQREVDN